MKFTVLLLCLLLEVVSGVLHYSHLRAALSGPITVCGKKGSGVPCHCRRSTINCNHAQLHTTNIVPSHDTANHAARVTQLTMQYCTLSGLFKGKILPGHEGTLIKLDVSYNFITFIQDRVFEDMHSLEELDLSYNHIHHLTREMFQGTDFSLLSLSLRENYLRNLTGRVFAELSSLKYLSLDDNPIRHMDKDTFWGLHSLVELSMDNTQLSHVEKDWFLGLSKLDTLSIRNARFLIVPSFHGMVNLQNLDLSHNPITSINSHAFEGLPHLHSIMLKHMPDLWAIEDCAFCSLNRLVELVVYNCSMLSFIDPDAFGKVKYFEKQIQVIDLERNDLTTLSAQLLPWENVTSVKLGENPWYCDCSIAWMNNKNLKYQGELATCYSPKRFKDKAVSLIHTGKLCQQAFMAGSTTGRIFVAITIILLIAGTVTLSWYLWLTRLNGPKLRNIFYRPDLPKYAYRNLAMNSETDDTVFDANETKKMSSNSRLPEPVAL